MVGSGVGLCVALLLVSVHGRQPGMCNLLPNLYARAVDNASTYKITVPQIIDSRVTIYVQMSTCMHMQAIYSMPECVGFCALHISGAATVQPMPGHSMGTLSLQVASYPGSAQLFHLQYGNAEATRGVWGCSPRKIWNF